MPSARWCALHFDWWEPGKCKICVNYPRRKKAPMATRRKNLQFLRVCALSRPCWEIHSEKCVILQWRKHASRPVIKVSQELGVRVWWKMHLAVDFDALVSCADRWLGWFRKTEEEEENESVKKPTSSAIRSCRYYHFSSNSIGMQHSKTPMVWQTIGILQPRIRKHRLLTKLTVFLQIPFPF